MDAISTKSRQNKIARMILDEGSAKIGELARAFAVSTETIRKDLIALDQQGVVRRNHGGAVVLDQSGTPGGARSAESHMRVAEKALGLVVAGATIILEHDPICRVLARRLTLVTCKVITNSLAVERVLRGSDVAVTLLGGEVHQGATSGLWAQHCLAQVKADVAFLGTTGFMGRTGPCTNGFDGAQIKRAMLASAKHAYVLAEGGLSSADSLVQYALWDDFDGVIIDSRADLRMLAQLDGRIDVMLA